LLPPLNLATAPAVSAQQLQVPATARKEYQQACAALKNKKAADAEKHLRKAVQAYPKYAAAWVTLGQVLAAQQRPDEARAACSQGSLADSRYVPGYLYEYHAAANLNRRNLNDAEKSGLRAVEIDTNHREPRVHFVLAQIYEAKGDKAKEASQLREFLKYATNPDDVVMVKQSLAELEKETAH
jgi:predicted Zn-dependent protease